jgi:hypothetical protein
MSEYSYSVDQVGLVFTEYRAVAFPWQLALFV